MEKAEDAKPITAKIISAKVMNDRAVDEPVLDEAAAGANAADVKTVDAKVAQMKTAIISGIDAIDAKDRDENAARGDEDRRGVARTRVQRGAKLIVQARSPVIHCTVQNLTSGGACLKLANTAGVPDSFELTFEHGRTRRACRVAWRTHDMLGVAFTGEETPVAS